MGKNVSLWLYTSQIHNHMNLVFLVFCFWLFPYLNYCFEEYMRSMPLGTVFRSTYQQHKKSSFVLIVIANATLKTQPGLLPSPWACGCLLCRQELHYVMNFAIFITSKWILKQCWSNKMQLVCVMVTVSMLTVEVVMQSFDMIKSHTESITYI